MSDNEETTFNKLQVGEHFTGKLEPGLVLCTKLSASKASYSFPPDIVVTFTLGKAGKTQWPVKRFNCILEAAKNEYTCN